MGLPMKQAALRLVAPYSKSQESEGMDQIGLGLSVLTLCLLPIERVVLPFGLRPADFALVLLILYGLGKVWRTNERLDFPLLIPMWLILLSSLVATLAGFAHSASIVAIVQEIYIFVWFIVLVNILKTSPASNLDRLMKIWSVIACLEAATTVMGMLRIGPSMFYTLSHSDQTITTGLVRSIGTYINSNAAAVYLSVSFFILLATSWPIWLRSVLGAWLLAGMFGTGSNGALISTLGGLVVLVIVHSITTSRRETMLWGTIIGMGAALAVVAVLTPGLLSSLLSGPGASESEHLLYLTMGRFSRSLGDRLELIKWAWQIYSRHPWGVGPNAFSTLRASLHNDYVAFLFERGPIGAIGWMLMVGATLLTPLQVANRLINKHQRWQVLALGAGFLACAVNAFSHEVSHMRQMWMLMAFLFALGYANLTQQAKCPRQYRTRYRK